MSHYFQLPNLNKMSHKSRDSCRVTGYFTIQTNHRLGKGSYGEVFTACGTRDCNYVAKVVNLKPKIEAEQDSHYVQNHFFAESLIAKFAGENGFGIPVHDWFLCGNGMQGVVIMDKFDGDMETNMELFTLEDYQNLFQLTNMMHRFGILHRDLYSRNVMFKKIGSKKEIRIIDFGLAIPFGTKIPRPLAAIDFYSLLMSIEDKKLRKKCREIIISKKYVSQDDLESIFSWKNDRETCKVEHLVLKYMPEHVVRNYGPMTLDLMVWSTDKQSCSSKQDKIIVKKTNELVDKVLSMSEDEINSEEASETSPSWLSYLF